MRLLGGPSQRQLQLLAIVAGLFTIAADKAPDRLALRSVTGGCRERECDGRAVVRNPTSSEQDFLGRSEGAQARFRNRLVPAFGIKLARLDPAQIFVDCLGQDYAAVDSFMRLATVSM